MSDHKRCHARSGCGPAKPRGSYGDLCDFCAARVAVYSLCRALDFTKTKKARAL